MPFHQRAKPQPSVDAYCCAFLIINSTCRKAPVRTKPVVSAILSHATLANTAPSGQGLICPVLMALTAISLPSIARMVPLSARSEVVIAAQFLYSGIKAMPLRAGFTAGGLASDCSHWGYCLRAALYLA